MLNTFTALFSALVIGTSAPVTTSAPDMWINSDLRIEHAAEVAGVAWYPDHTITTLVTEDGEGWRIEGELDPTRLYCVVFDTQGTADITDDAVLFAVAMD